MPPKNRSDYKIPDEFKIGPPAYVSIERSPYFLGVESCAKPGGHFSEDYFLPFHDMHIRQRRLVVLYHEELFKTADAFKCKMMIDHAHTALYKKSCRNEGIQLFAEEKAFFNRSRNAHKPSGRQQHKNTVTTVISRPYS